MNIVTFTFKTEAPWTANELDDLNSQLAEVVQGMDDDAVADSCSATVEPETERSLSVSAEMRRQIIEEFLSDSEVTARVNLAINGIGIETTLS